LEYKIVPGSISRGDKVKVMRVVLTDDKESLAIVYEGIVPDNFKPGADLVVDGRYWPDNTFKALSFHTRKF